MCSKSVASHRLHSKIPVLGKSVSVLPKIQIKTLTQEASTILVETSEQ